MTLKSVLYFINTMILFSLVACLPKKETTVKIDSGPLCGLLNSSRAIMVCIEYPKGTPLSTVDTNCRNEKTLYSSDGATSFAITEAATIYCDVEGVAGKCVSNGNKISYYASEFTAGQAESACFAIGGTFQ